MRRRRAQPESTPLNPGKVVPLAGNLVSGRGTVLATPLQLYSVAPLWKVDSSHLLGRRIRLLTGLNALLAAGISLVAYGMSACADEILGKAVYAHWDRWGLHCCIDADCVSGWKACDRNCGYLLCLFPTVLQSICAISVPIGVLFAGSYPSTTLCTHMESVHAGLLQFPHPLQ